MTPAEWESLCDGCGRCCLNKLEDEERPERTYFTDIGCRLLDTDACRCTDYKNRQKSDIPFWRRKTLEQMTPAEWESLCDGCGRCCLNKLEDEDKPERTYFTDIGCRLLDTDACRCTDYKNRQKKVKDCVRLTPATVRRIVWLPPTCAYSLLAKGRDLYWWHPLVSGDPETVHLAGVSVRGRVPFSEKDVPDSELEDHIVSWPGKVPKAARAARGVKCKRGRAQEAGRAAGPTGMKKSAASQVKKGAR